MIQPIIYCRGRRPDVPHNNYRFSILSPTGHFLKKVPQKVSGRLCRKENVISYVCNCAVETIRDFSLRVSKINHQQRKMIWLILRHNYCTFSNIF